MLFWFICPAIYALWFLCTSKDKVSTEAWGPVLLVQAISTFANAVLRVLGVTNSVVMEAPLVPGTQYMICSGPHGAMAFSGVLFVGPSWRLRPEFAPIKIFSIGASILFYLPLVRELILLFGCREVTKTTTTKLIKAGHHLTHSLSLAHSSHSFTLTHLTSLPLQAAASG
jgi:hypothetical protein